MLEGSRDRVCVRGPELASLRHHHGFAASKLGKCHRRLTTSGDRRATHGQNQIKAARASQYPPCQRDMEVTFEKDNDALTHESNQPAAPIPSRVDVDPRGRSPCGGRLLRARVSTAPGVAFNRGPCCADPALGGCTTRPGTLFGRRSATGVPAGGSASSGSGGSASPCRSASPGAQAGPAEAQSRPPECRSGADDQNNPSTDDIDHEER